MFHHSLKIFLLDFHPSSYSVFFFNFKREWVKTPDNQFCDWAKTGYKEVKTRE